MGEVLFCKTYCILLNSVRKGSIQIILMLNQGYPQIPI
jgi:hypothetical protein